MSAASPQPANIEETRSGMTLMDLLRLLKHFKKPVVGTASAGFVLLPEGENVEDGQAA